MMPFVESFRAFEIQEGTPQEGMDTRKDGSVRVRSSIKWSMPDVEQHGEKN